MKRGSCLRPQESIGLSTLSYSWQQHHRVYSLNGSRVLESLELRHRDNTCDCYLRPGILHRSGRSRDCGMHGIATIPMGPLHCHGTFESSPDLDFGGTVWMMH